MFLHNVSSKSWVLKTKIKFSDNDVSVSVGSSALWRQKKGRDVMDVV